MSTQYIYIYDLSNYISFVYTEHIRSLISLITHS